MTDATSPSPSSDPQHSAPLAAAASDSSAPAYVRPEEYERLTRCTLCDLPEYRHDTEGCCPDDSPLSAPESAS